MRRMIILKPGDTLIKWREVSVRMHLNGRRMTIVHPFPPSNTDTDKTITAEAIRKVTSRYPTCLVLETQVNERTAKSRAR